MEGFNFSAVILPILLLAISLIGTYLTQLSVKKKEKKLDYQKIQVEKIQQLFALLADLNLENFSLFESTTNFNHFELKNRVTKWILSYLKFRRFFLMNQIIFPTALNAEIKPQLEKLRSLALEVKSIKTTLNETEEEAGGNFNNIYSSVEDEIEASNKILSNLNKNDNLNDLKNSISTTLLSIETHFKNLII